MSVGAGNLSSASCRPPPVQPSSEECLNCRSALQRPERKWPKLPTEIEEAILDRTAVATMIPARYARSGSDQCGKKRPLRCGFPRRFALSLPERAGRSADTDPKTVTFSEREIREAARLLEHIIRNAPELVDVVMKPPLRAAGGEGHGDRRFLLDLARRAVFERQRRTAFFDQAMFGEPAWDMLLALYVADFVGGKQTIGNLAELVDVPVSTVVRWAGQLERNDCIIREPHPHDRRAIFVRLTDKAREGLDAYFSSLAQ